MDGASCRCRRVPSHSGTDWRWTWLVVNPLEIFLRSFYSPIVQGWTVFEHLSNGSLGVNVEESLNLPCFVRLDFYLSPGPLHLPVLVSILLPGFSRGFSGLGSYKICALVSKSSVQRSRTSTRSRRVTALWKSGTQRWKKSPPLLSCSSDLSWLSPRFFSWLEGKVVAWEPGLGIKNSWDKIAGVESSCRGSSYNQLKCCVC